MSSSTVRRLVRWGAAAVAAAALAWTVAVHLERRAERAEMARVLAATGVAERQPELADRVLREPDTRHAELLLARALLDDAMAPDAAVESLESRLAKLQQAHDLAAAVAAERPALWQAPMLVGATTYMMWSLDGDPRVLRERDAWRAPLERALELAPGKREPLRLLSAALIEVWPALGPDEKAAGRELLRQAFDDPTSLNALAGGWLQVAADRTDALALIPDRSDAWRTVEQHLGRAGDWAAYGEVHDRRLKCMASELTDLVAEMNAALAGGDPELARSTAQRITALAPPDLRWRDDVAEALRRAPAGAPASSWISRSYRSWLLWALEGTLRDIELLDPEVIARLRLGAGELSPAVDTLALFASGRENQAMRVERRRDDLNTEAWAPYCLVRARAAAEHGDREAAASMFRLMHRSLRALPEAARVELLIFGHPPLPTPWWSAAPQLAASAWPGTDWRWRERQASLDLVSAVPAPGLALSLDVVPPAGAVLEVDLDFRTVWVGVVERGDTVELNEAIEPGPHLVRLTSVAGGRVVPGHVSLHVPERRPL